MSEFILTALAIVGAFTMMCVTMYRIGPALSESLTAWAWKQEVSAEKELITAWADGHEAGREFERMKHEATK